MYERLSTRRIISFIIISELTLLGSQSVLSENNPWEDYHSSCPYNNFCTRNATKIIKMNETNLVSCCQECSCDPDCQKFGVCCPDYNLVAGIDVIYPCVLLDDYFNYPRGFDEETMFHLKYHIIDDCQLFVKHRNQCETPVHLEDFVFVSDITNGRVYKNKHCALCHGVKEYEEWDIVTTCAAIDNLSFETFEERDKYIVKYCRIIPYPSPLQAKSLYRCVDTHINENCENVDDSYEVDESIVSSCERHTPYTNELLSSRDWFKNIYCFWCNRKTAFSQNLLCDDMSLMFRQRSWVSFTMLLDTERRSSGMSERCNTSSIWDPYTDSCLRLYCSPGSIPSSGKCRSVSRESNGVDVAMVFNVELNCSIEVYIQNLSRSYLSILMSEVGDKIPCASFDTRLLVKPTHVFFISYFSTRDSCNRDFLTEKMLGWFSNSVIVRFVYLNTIVEARLTPSTVSYEMIAHMLSNLNETFAHAWHNVFRSCPRIDYRMVPLFPDTMFQGNIIDNTVCVRDYFKYAELLSNAKCTLKQNLHVLIFDILLFIGLVLN